MVVVSPDRSRTQRRRAQLETLRASKASSFRRTSENTREAERQATHEVRRLSKLEAAGPRGFDWEDECAERESLSFGMGSGSAASVLVTKPRFDVLYDAMLAEDQSTFDADGWVR